MSRPERAEPVLAGPLGVAPPLAGGPVPRPSFPTAPVPTLDEALTAHSASFFWRALPWLVVLLLLGGGVGAIVYSATRERAVPVDVILVEEGEVERTVASVSAGRIAARRRAKVAADVMARVVARHAKKGDRVAKDQVVVELDAREAQANLEMARAARDAATSAIGEAQARLDMAQSDYDRRKKTAPGVVAPELVDRASKEVSALERQIAALRSRVVEAEARIRSGETAVAKYTVRAPFAGVLSELWVEVGEVPSMTGTSLVGKNALEGGGAHLFEVIDLDDLYVTAPIDEVDLARVTSGLVARVTLDPFPKEPFQGVVTRVAPFVLDVEDQNRTLEVEVSIPESWRGRPLKPGTSADVEIVVERKAKAPRLPAHLLLDGRRALVVEPGSVPGELRVVERELKVGIENWRFAEVSGIPLGAQVVAGGEVRVKPGALVTIRKKLEAGGPEK